MKDDPSDDLGLGIRELQRRAASGATWSMMTTVISLPLAIVVSVVVARSLGPHEFARFAYLSFLVPLLIAITDCGVSPASTRETSRTFAAGELDATREVLGKVLGWNLLRLPIVCALVLVVARPDIVVACLLVGGLTVIFAGSSLLLALQAENRGATSAKLVFVQGVVSSFGAIGAAAGGSSGTTVFVVTFVSTATVVPGWLVVSNPDLRRAAMRPRLPRGLPREFWRYGLSALGLALVSTLVFSRSEVVILEALGEHQALAVFALAFGLAQRVTTPVDALLGPLIPALSALAVTHPDRLRSGFARALRFSMTGAAFLGAVAVVGTVLAAPILFGPEYGGTGAAFAALAGVSLVQSVAQPYIAVAHALGRLAGLVRANLWALGVDLAVAIALIPWLGLWGAVIANAAGGLLALGLSVRALPEMRGAFAAGVPAARLVAVTAVSMAVAYAGGTLCGELDPVAGALAAFALGSCCFVFLTRLTGGVLLDSDARVLLEVLPRPVARLALAVVLVRRNPSQRAGP